MTVVELVERQRARIRSFEVLAGVALGVILAAAVLVVGALALGKARWLALPRGTPFAIWAVLAAGVIAIVRVTRRRLASNGSRREVAAAIERERGLRAGSLRGAIE